MFCSSAPVAKTVIIGSAVEFSCSSSFPPSWLWLGPQQQRPKTLAYVGTQPHPNLKDDRFSFFKRESDYVIQITNVKTTDAGKFVCEADAYIEYSLNVVRYVCVVQGPQSASVCSFTCR